jgi:hypothetical protein
MLTAEEVTPVPAVVRSRRDRLFEPVPLKTVGLVVAATAIGYWIMQILEPAPAHPEMAHALVYTLLDTAFMGTLFIAAVGLLQRHRFGLQALVANATIQLVGVFAYPISGHHAWGVWWIAQLFVGLCVLGVTAGALAA